MTRAFLFLVLILGLLASPRRTEAFSLNGQIPPWFTDQTGLFPNGGDIYGPVNLGEEYRWVVPTITYAFDESFLNHFGKKGVEEVEKAVQILNDLPALSTADLSAYPNYSQRVNHRARDLGLFDLKTETLKTLLEELGLGTPGRFVFTIRVRATVATPPQTNYLVVMRNFDPETWLPTPYINGQLWTYNTIYDNQDSPRVKGSTVNEPVDPLIFAEPVASSVNNFGFSVYGGNTGFYATGLTKDDVGGLRYIYRKDNYNVETLPADASSGVGFGGGGASSGSGGGGSSSDWLPIGSQDPQGGGTIDDWVAVPPTVLTNATGNAGGGGAGAGAGAGGTTTAVGTRFYTQALRGGIDKIRFVRGAGIYQPNGFASTNRWQETIRVVSTNGVEKVVTQRVTRILNTPDILFTAADLAQPDASVRILTRTATAVNNDAINGLPGQVVAADGPGQFNGGVTIAYNKLGSSYLNIVPLFLAQPAEYFYPSWGSFDGTTNDPAVYPVGTTIRELERTVFGSR